KGRIGRWLAMSEEAVIDSQTHQNINNNDVINVPLTGMNYKQLQNLAKQWSLPANLK
ncbi:hypothetical protein L9F63_007801, partial [Diploptera punctata]